MSKNKNKTETPKRPGRPEKDINIPNATFVRADLVPLNPQLHKQSVYAKVKKLLAAGQLKETGYALYTEERGRPEMQLQPISLWNANQKRKAKAKGKASPKVDLAKVPEVEVTPATEPVEAKTEAEPVSA